MFGKTNLLRKAFVAFFLTCLLTITNVAAENEYDKYRTRERTNNGYPNDEAEVLLAKEIHKEITKKMILVHDTAINSYINNLGQKLARRTERPNIPWHFYVVDDKSVNAFATIGGYVYVSMGLLSHVDSEFQLASAIAHECGHIAARHGLDNIKRAKRSIDIGWLLSGSYLMKHSREAEHEADFLALYNIVRCGFNTRGMIEMFGILDEISSTYRKVLGEIIVGKPPAIERLRNVLQEIQEHLQKSDQRGNTNTTEFAQIKLTLPAPTILVAKDTLPPRIVIASPPVERGVSIQSTSNRTVVTGQAVDDSGILEVQVSGVAARFNERGSFSAEVTLQIGENPITVTATDKRGNRAEEEFMIIRKIASAPAVAQQIPQQIPQQLPQQRPRPTASATPVPPISPVVLPGHYYALVIGINKYQHLGKLGTAISDAREIERLLRNEFGFETNLLLDAGRDEISNALNQYQRSLDEQSRLLIYYAGHGTFDETSRNAYWLPANAERSNDTNWISAVDITAKLNRIPARHVLIISDSCYSGTIARTDTTRLTTPLERERYLREVDAAKSRILIASGGNEPVMDSGGGNHSVFAVALLRGLREMSENIFTAEEIFRDYVLEPVAGKSDQKPEYSSIRNSGHDGGDFLFVRKRQ